MEKIQVE